MKLYEIYDGKTLMSYHFKRHQAVKHLERLTRLGRDVSNYTIKPIELKHHDIKQHFEEALKRKKD